jgi:flagellar motility protein MotE (MotC chaperone)
MLGKIRVLPIVILAAMMLLGIKVVELRRGVADFGFATAWAQSDKTKDDTGKDKQPKPKADKADTAAAEQSKSPAPRDNPDAEADQKAKLKADEDAAKKKLAMRARASRKTKFTSSEIEVLQKLSGRREVLEQRSRQMAMREKILQATEKRIDNKIGELKKLEGRIKGLLLEHDKEGEAQIKSLVKVYESMKPKEAARIFEELEMDILLNVTERMKEVKMAKILAAMAPKKAKTLTVRLATRRRLPKTGG